MATTSVRPLLLTSGVKVLARAGGVSDIPLDNEPGVFEIVSWVPSSVRSPLASHGEYYVVQIKRDINGKAFCVRPENVVRVVV